MRHTTTRQPRAVGATQPALVSPAKQAMPTMPPVARGPLKAILNHWAQKSSATPQNEVSRRIIGRTYRRIKVRYNGCCRGRTLKLKFRFKLSSQSDEWSLRLIVGTGYALILIWIESPRRSDCRCFPSNATEASARASSGTKQRKTTWSGNTMDRKDKTWAHTGVTKMDGTPLGGGENLTINHMSKEQQRQLNTTYGCTTEDPAASE